jgi:very-short-patch-repair endonuclease
VEGYAGWLPQQFSGGRFLTGKFFELHLLSIRNEGDGRLGVGVGWDINATIAAKIGFASHQNAIPVIRELNVSSTAGRVLEGLTLSLFADPPFVQPKSWRIDRLDPGDTLRITDRDIALNATLLHDLTESLSGTLTFLLTDREDAKLVERCQPVELLAHNHWGGAGAMADLLPAFVMPNDPAIDRVIKAASDVLRRAGKPDALDGYNSGRRERVWELASAIWSAVAGLRLSYALPPASFEQAGQKIRTPSQILDGRVATCLDTALLFAAALEQSSLNPLLVLTKDHAFVGVWLQPAEFATLLTNEAAAVRRRLDLDDLIVFETTLATHNPPATFSQAIAAARRQIAEDAEARFEMAVDVRRARMQKIRPLGVASATLIIADDAPPVAEALEAAPTLPPFEVEAAESGLTPSGRILQWQRKLLNLTTSNRLLHLPESASAVRLLCPDPGALEDLLASGKKVRIAPMPELDIGGRDEKLYEQQTQGSLRMEIAEAAMKRGEALSVLPKDKLDAALVDLYRKTRTDLEEGGANTLFLALGFLKWKKSPGEEKLYRAPLILLPLRLERKSALSGVTMTAHGDEARFNLTLLELLRQDFELTIPGLDGELPKDKSGIDVAGIWRSVRTAVRDMAGFEVLPDVAIGTFSFAKYLMWKDLVDRADQLKESALVRHLIDRDGTLATGTGGSPRADELDRIVQPASLFTPLPADSSQLLAVVRSADGQDFVLDGPPGTGKSQTIANMIAHNLALGRRVLFVAEKRAALDVVQRRLADKGLGPLCLELHSAKATKSAVLQQLDRAWTTRDALSAEEWEREASETRRLRDELNAVVAVLHRREPNGLTIHRAIGHAVRDATDVTPKLVFPASVQHDAAEMMHFRDIARRLGLARGAVADLPTELDSVARTDWSNSWQDEIGAAAAVIPAMLDEVVQARDALATTSCLKPPGEDRAQLGRFLVFAELCLSMHGHDLRFAFAPEMVDRVAAARQALALIELYRSEEDSLSTTYASEAARRIDINAIRAAWTQANAKIWLLKNSATRKVALVLAQTGGAAGVVEPEVDLPKLASMRDLIGKIDAVAPQAAAMPGWAGLTTDVKAVEDVIARGERLRALIAAEADGPESLMELRRATAMLVVDANDMLAADGAVATAARRLRRALDHLDGAVAGFDMLAQASTCADFAALRLRAQVVVQHGRRLRDWTNWRRVRDEAVQAGLAPLVEALERGSVTPAVSLAAFETSYARWFAAKRMDEEPLLKTFMAGEQEDRIARFRALDDRMGELASRYIRAKLCGLIPDKNEVSKRGGYGSLKYQLQLQRPSMPIRKLAAEMGDAFTRLAPCMLMSPLSIAQYLPPDQALFDLVIFDEASQITPWDAIGAMARGKQVVIAGDPRQMPPSNDFARASGASSADDDTEADLDSILDECLAAGVPQQSLDWHYRSRHESLITFSNVRYYDSKLVTFPPPVTRSSAVSWRRVDGVYARGAGRINPIEAQAIVNEAVARLRDPGFVNERGEPLSLGIITMNAEQMRLVEDLLDKACRDFPEIEPHFDEEERLEPVCVRNLETVQGDERDVILLGIGFGPTEPGGKTMSMAFGKLNRDGGWRRLNVAVTRARMEMKVFTSFDPGMIDLTRTSQQAIADLKHFIEFADRGPRAIAEAVKGSMGGADSPFEEAVILELRRRGWTVVPQVGVTKFRIDLGIVHPDRPGDYLLGIECDGATYHSAATARDRDKVRAAILEGLGWQLLRVWSTDWWIDKQRSADRLHALIDERLTVDRQTADERAAVRSAVSPPVRAIGDLVATPSEPDGTQASPLLAPSITVAIDEADTALTESVYARAAEPVVELVAAFAGDGRYHVTDFAPFASAIEPARFYDPSYDTALITFIAHVLTSESPITEALLVQRIARAHGFQRAGRIIRDRVMMFAERLHHIEEEMGGGRFVWTDTVAPSTWRWARAPASENDIRQIEEIALAELRVVAKGDDSVEVARSFGIRRLTAAARVRIEMAQGSD